MVGFVLYIVEGAGSVKEVRETRKLMRKVRWAKTEDSGV